MISVRKSSERGYDDHGWGQSHFSFSFADYHDPAHMGFGVLRALMEDAIAPAGGFGTHPHRDMEIVSVVLAGELTHRDSMGNTGVLRPGDVQRMSAGQRRAAQRIQPRHTTSRSACCRSGCCPGRAASRRIMCSSTFRTPTSGVACCRWSMRRAATARSAFMPTLALYATRLEAGDAPLRHLTGRTDARPTSISSTVRSRSTAGASAQAMP
jgi:hypothetical protein